METTKVNKSDYEVYQFISGYFGICKAGHPGVDCIFGGDSANEDDYNEDYIRGVYDQWDGTLTRYGNNYVIEI